MNEETHDFPGTGSDSEPQPNPAQERYGRLLRPSDKARNLVVCLDGTGNEVEKNISNVLKLYRSLMKTKQQLVYYSPGVGIIGNHSLWDRAQAKINAFEGLAVGTGLDDNVLGAYDWLSENYRKGDRIILFGFSRGAYSARVLAGLLTAVGLLKADQKNLSTYALRIYKSRGKEKVENDTDWYRKVLATQNVNVHFMGLWDTVHSVIVPRPSRPWAPLTFEVLPYTEENYLAHRVRHAVAIDERRRMFRPFLWKEPQIAKAAKHAPKEKERVQDIKQVWFAGVHSDVGGGYRETLSGLAKYPLWWMIGEAADNGLLFRKQNVNRVVFGKKYTGDVMEYTPPSIVPAPQNSLKWYWWPLELFPKIWASRETRNHWFFWLYFPFGERRKIPEDALFHESVQAKLDADASYRPPGVPRQIPEDRIVGNLHYELVDPDADQDTEPLEEGAS